MPFHEGQQSSPGTCWPYPRPSLGSSQEAGPQPSLPPLHEPQAGRLSAENQQDGDKARPQLRSRPAAERFRPESQCCCPQLEKVLDPRLSWKEGARTFWKNWMALEPCPTPPQDTVKGLEQGRVDLKPTPKPRVRPKPASSGRGFLGHWTLVLTRQTGCWGASAPHSCMELSRHRAGTQIHPRDGALPHTPSARSRHRHIRTKEYPHLKASCCMLLIWRHGARNLMFRVSTRPAQGHMIFKSYELFTKKQYMLGHKNEPQSVKDYKIIEYILQYQNK